MGRRPRAGHLRYPAQGMQRAAPGFCGNFCTSCGVDRHFVSGVGRMAIAWRGWHEGEVKFAETRLILAVRRWVLGIVRVNLGVRECSPRM